MIDPTALRGYDAKLFMANLRASRVAAGVCVQCGAPELETSRRCAKCAKNRLDSGRARAARREAEGLAKSTSEQRQRDGTCPRCGGPRDTGYVTCSACRDSNRIYRATDGALLIAERATAGKCLRCGDVAVDNGTLCAKHAELATAHSVRAQRALRKRRAVAETCECCQAPRLPTLRHCPFHYVQKILRAYLNVPPEGLVEKLVAKFDGRCAYSGLEISMGGIGQLEHIYPKRHCPALVIEPSNLVWAHVDVNNAKGDLMPDSPALDAFMLPAVLARIRALASAVVHPTQADNIPA